MLKVTMLALGASLSIAAIAPNQASAQLSGRQRTAGRYPTSTTTTQNGRVYQDGVCTDQRYDRDGDRDDERPNRPHDNGKHKGWYKHGKHERDDDGNGCGNTQYCRDNDGRVVRDVNWCRQTGRQIYSDNSVYNNGTYNNGSNSTIGTISDIILRRPRYNEQNMNYNVLQQVLGSGVLNRIDQARYQLGYNGPLTGRWYDVSGGSEVDLFANGLQIAQILDRNRDGRADVFRWTNGR